MVHPSHSDLIEFGCKTWYRTGSHSPDDSMSVGDLSDCDVDESPKLGGVAKRGRLWPSQLSNA